MTSASARVQPTRSLFLCEVKPFLYYKCGHAHWNSAHFECMQQRDVDGSATVGSATVVRRRRRGSS